LAGCAENDDLVCAGGQRAIEATHIGSQYGIQRAGAPLDAAHDFSAVGHLRNPLRRNERGCLDIGEAGVGEPVDKLDLDLGGDELLFVLKAVARGYLDDLDFIRGGHVVSWYRRTVEFRLTVNDTVLAAYVAAVVEALNDVVELQFRQDGSHPGKGQSAAFAQQVDVGRVEAHGGQDAAGGRVLHHSVGTARHACGLPARLGRHSVRHARPRHRPEARQLFFNVATLFHQLGALAYEGMTSARQWRMDGARYG